MSTFAAARVETRIVLQGEGNAARAVKETREQLDGMGASAGKATAAASTGFAQYAAVAQQSLSKIGGAFSAVNAVIGGTNPIMQKLGQSFTAAGAVANIIPGPIGLAAAAMTGLAVATYKFVEAANQAEAKTKFMRGGAGSEAMATQLGITQDAVLGVQQSLEDLSDAGLKPTESELRAVRDRAEAMGKDGSKAVEQFIGAIAKGPEALREVQKEIGDLGIKNIGDLGASIGLSKASLGLEKDLTDAKVQQAELLKEYAAIQARTALLGGAILESDRKDLEVITAKAGALEGRLSAERQLAREQKVADTNSQLAKGRIALLDVQASQQKDKSVGDAIKIQAIDLRLADIAQRYNLILRNRGAISAEQFNVKVQEVQLEQAQAEAAKKAIFDAAEADRKSRREAAAAKSKERIQAETDATIKLAQAREQVAEASSRDPASDPAVLAAKLKVIDLEASAAQKAARARVNTATGRENELRAIELNATAEREKVQKEFDAARIERAQKETDLRKEMAQERLQAEIDAQSKIDELAASQSERNIEKMRERGEFHAATLAEIEAAEKASAAAIEKINRDLAASLVGLDEESDLAAKQRQLAAAQVAAEQQKLATATADSYAKQSASTADAIDKQIGSIEKITGAALQAGGLGDFGKAVGGIAGNVLKGSEALDQFNAAQKSGNLEQMAKANQGLSAAIDGTISASGAAAAAFVEDERTKAGILALTETAAAIVAFATPGMQAQGIAHAAAAAIYAGIAGGAIPTGGAGSATAASTTGATTGGGGEVTGMTGAGAAVGAGTMQVFNFNKGFVIGSTQEVAKGISGTLRSVNGTGYDKRKAA